MEYAFIGDVMLGRVVNQRLRKRKGESVWGDLLTILSKADFRMCNLECAISDDGEPWSQTPKEFHFRSDPKNVQVLRAAGMNVVSLANNHSLDYGYTSLDDTIRILDKAQIEHAGAGLSLEEARRPAFLSVGKTKIGIVAFTDNEPEWEAGEKTSGIFYAPTELEDHRAKKLLEVVKKTKPAVDTLIVSAHWGGNWGYPPPEEHTLFAHAVIDAGADIVFGHSCHVFRGVEIYRGRPILYSAGDFIDDYAVDSVERNDESFVIMVDKEGKDFTHIMLYPTKIEDCHARKARGPETYAIAEKMQTLSAKFKTFFTWNEEKGYLECEV